jgi:hypothetical protein
MAVYARLDANTGKQVLCGGERGGRLCSGVLAEDWFALHFADDLRKALRPGLHALPMGKIARPTPTIAVRPPEKIKVWCDRCGTPNVVSLRRLEADDSAGRVTDTRLPGGIRPRLARYDRRWKREK